MGELGILEELKKLVLMGDAEGAVEVARKAVEKRVDPIHALENGLAEGLRQVGEAFGRGEAYLYELVVSAEAMKKASFILEEEIRKSGRKKEDVGTLVVGTVAGDIHDIGKTIVSTFFTAAGFKVYDLGIDVPTERFIEAIEKHKPDLLGLSSLLSVSSLEAGKVIETLNEKKLRYKVKVLIGGGAVSRDMAEKMGADGYAGDGLEAVALGKKLLAKNKGC